MISPMRYVSTLTPASSIVGEHRGQRQLDRRGRAARRRARGRARAAGRAAAAVAAAWRTSAAVSSSASGSGMSSTPYSAARSSRLVLRPAGLDQVREDHRVVDAPRPASAFASCATSSPSSRSGRGADDDLARRRRSRARSSSTATAVSPVGATGLLSRHGTVDAGWLERAPPLGAPSSSSSTRLEQVAELEAPEHLLQLSSGPGGESTSSAGSQSSSRSRRIVASSFAPRAWSACSRIAFERAGVSSSTCSSTSSSEPYCAISCPAVLSPIPGTPGMLSGGVALEADEVRHLLGRDARAAPRRAPACRRGRRRRRAGSSSARRCRVTSWKASRSVETTVVLIPASSALVRERRDHVVRLPALELEVPVAEGLDDRPEERELLAQQVGHRLALDLVGLEQLRSGAPGRVSQATATPFGR